MKGVIQYKDGRVFILDDPQVSSMIKMFKGTTYEQNIIYSETGLTQRESEIRKSELLKRSKDSEIKLCDIKLNALHSARYILEDLNNPKGFVKMSELTGLPEGVIAAAFENIFK